MKNCKVILFFIGTVGFIPISISQNLVINPSFEEIIGEYKVKTKDPYTLNLAFGWSAPESSSDLYSRWANKKNFRIPNVMMGYQEVIFGDLYAGIYSSMQNGGGPTQIYKEDIQGTLSDSLEKDKTYLIKFYFSLAERSEYSETSLGITFSNTKLSCFADKVYFKGIYAVKTIDKQALSDKDNWQEFSQFYTAKGGEKYVLIGNFEGEKEWKSNHRNFKSGEFSYYYIDNVSVTLVDTVLANVNDTSAIIEINKKIVLDNIYFEFGSSALKETSYPALDQLYQNLERIIKVGDVIEIAGFTDNIGQEEDNIILSEARAKAVADYLITKGIERERIKYIGFGSAQPIATNETNEGREQNRRVEFIIKTKKD